jgi:hypothetical protein
MFDPEYASRGPGTTARPTTVLTYYSTSSITVAAYSNAGAGQAAAGQPHMMDINGCLAVITTPLAAWNVVGTATRTLAYGAPGTMVPGFTAPGNFDMSGSFYRNSTIGPFAPNSLGTLSTTNSGANPPGSVNAMPGTVTPLGTFNAAFPIEPTVIDNNPQPNLTDYTPFRILGMRTTI